MSDALAEGRFRQLFADNERDLLAYALRRVERPEDAADIVAETFLTAWRRLGKVPEGDDGRLWLFGVARRQIANQRRSRLRQSRLADRLRHELPAAIATSARSAEDHRAAAVIAALGRLDDEDREILRLTAWEGLTPIQVAKVMNLPGPTVRTRLHRARGRLRAEVLEAGPNPLDSTTNTPTTEVAQ